ncbi:ISL3 family transposase, partial [Weissella confusa]
TDPNITFDPKEQQHYTIANDNGTETLTWNLFLTYETTCEKCGNAMVNNGTKLVTHKGPRSAFRFHNFKIRKQKFKCQKCGH